MQNEIINATVKDLPIIYQLFEEAIHFQRKNNYVGWNSYDKDFIKADINNGLLYKITRNEDILGIFSICYSDELIWRENENSDAIYLHRIVLNQRFKGEKIFQKILDWSILLAKEKKLKSIRMDTWADNEKIISYYKSYGFKFIENYTTPATEDLPIQHRNLRVALLQLDIDYSDFSFDSLKKINIKQEFATINLYWSQKIIGKTNGQLIKLAKGKGEIKWHKHDDQDELFILYKGNLTIQLRDRKIEMYEGDMFIVPKGIEHCPRADEEVEFLIMGLSVTSGSAVCNRNNSI
ncbi:MAG: GNAT family N-acetyltransferase [Cyclobacteriaceae bacterium]|nr:GNAT family N-acetyltransferase [Cyclobacteriaceae bacterium]